MRVHLSQHYLSSSQMVFPTENAAQPSSFHAARGSVGDRAWFESSASTVRRKSHSTRGLAVENIAEPALQPAFAGRVIMTTVDGLIQYMRVIASEADDLLF